MPDGSSSVGLQDPLLAGLVPLLGEDRLPEQAPVFTQFITQELRPRLAAVSSGLLDPTDEPGGERGGGTRGGFASHVRLSLRSGSGRGDPAGKKVFREVSFLPPDIPV